MNVASTIAILGGVAVLALVACRRGEQAAPPPVDGAADAGPSMAYATRVAELRLGSPTGPVVGRLHPGARAEITPVDAGHVRFALPRGFARYGSSSPSVVAPSDAFSAKPVPRLAPTLLAPGRLVRDVEGLEVRPTAEPGEPFASTICGEVHVLSPDDAAPARVAQVHAGFEILGWIDHGGDARRGLRACGVRAVVRRGDGLSLVGGATFDDEEPLTAVPPGFVAEDPEDARDELAERIADGQPLYWLVQTSRVTTACRQWRFARLPKGSPSDLVFVRREAIATDEGAAFASFGVAYARPNLSLSGPHYTKRPIVDAPSAPSVGGYRCVTPFRYVGTDGGALRIGVGGHREGATLVAWHPDDEERWYADQASCDAARARADASLAAEPDAVPPGGVHHDCFPELAR